MTNPVLQIIIASTRPGRAGAATAMLDELVRWTASLRALRDPPAQATA